MPRVKRNQELWGSYGLDKREESTTAQLLKEYTEKMLTQPEAFAIPGGSVGGMTYRAFARGLEKAIGKEAARKTLPYLRGFPKRLIEGMKEVLPLEEFVKQYYPKENPKYLLGMSHPYKESIGLASGTVPEITIHELSHQYNNLLISIRNSLSPKQLRVFETLERVSSREEFANEVTNKIIGRPALDQTLADSLDILLPQRGIK